MSYAERAPGPIVIALKGKGSVAQVEFALAMNPPFECIAKDQLNFARQIVKTREGSGKWSAVGMLQGLFWDVICQ